MDLQHLISAYGYWAIIAGTFLEGETILILGGLAAHEGYLALSWVIVSAFIGSLSGDQLYFLLGRKYGTRILAQWPSLQARAVKANRLLVKFQTWLIVGFRFMYGFRIVTPFVIGMSSVTASRFFIFNALGALIWAAGIGTGGYLLGRVFVVLLGNVEKYEVKSGMAIIILGVLLWMIVFFRRRKSKKP